MEKEGDKIN